MSSASRARQEAAAAASGAGRSRKRARTVGEIGDRVVARSWHGEVRVAYSRVRPDRSAEGCRLLRDLKVALLFLTRFPVQIDETVTMRDLAAAVYAFPLVGAVVGLLAGLAFVGAALLGLPPPARRR